MEVDPVRPPGTTNTYPGRSHQVPAQLMAILTAKLLEI